MEPQRISGATANRRAGGQVRGTAVEPSQQATPLRADAERNRAKIVAAARAVFSEAGTDVPAGRVARRAGVGLATLYRRFPTREDLVNAAFADQHAECRRMLEHVERHPDPWRALRHALARLCEDQVHDKGFTARVLTDRSGENLERFRDEIGRIDALIGRAHTAGTLRRDVGRAEFCLLVAGNAGVIAAAGPAPRAASRRYVDMVLRSFTAPSR